MKDFYRGIQSPSLWARSVASIAALIGLCAYGPLATTPAAGQGRESAPSTGSVYYTGSPSDVGPVRLARLAYVSGNVSWRPEDQGDWSQAVRNLPVRQGAQFWVSRGSRAELQFDDGSRLYMSRGAVVTLRTLYSDADGEYTELAVSDGTIGLTLRKGPSVYQIDTPIVSVDASGPARFRVDDDNGVQVAVRQGRCAVEGSQGKATLDPGDYIDLHSDRDPYDIRRLASRDDFDDWTNNYDQREDRYWNSPYRHYLPNDVAIVSDDLDDYGSWRRDPRYGEVWYPHERLHGWRPYHDGHWVWEDPFGWTWVSDEPWGWAPYHYGTWVDEPYGWAWVPGPASQYWSPAVVDFYDYNNSVAWCPLAPTEVQYPPSLSIGFSQGDWSLFFSIGAAAVYYPTYGGHYVPYAWSTPYVNNVAYVNNVTNITNYNGYGGYGGPAINHNTYFVNSGYVPVNARMAAGASLASISAFGGRGVYQSLPRDPRPAFTRGRLVGAPTGSFAPVAGPPEVRPTAIARTPTRTWRAASPVSHAVLARPIYSAPNPIRSRMAARQGLPGAAGAGAALGTRVPARPVTGRVPSVEPRTPPAAMARTTAPPPVTAAQRPAPPAISREQRAAMQARTALGLRPAARPAAPAAQGGNRPVLFHRGARPSAAPAPRPNVVRPPQRPSAPGQSPAQRAAMQARTALGLRPAARPAAPRVNRAPAPIGSRAPHPAARPAQPNRMTAPRPAPQVRRYTPPARRPAAPVHNYAPPVRHTAPPVRQYAPPVRRTAPPVHTYTPPVRRYTPPVRHYQPPVRSYSPPVQHYQAPARRYAPPVRTYSPPVRRYTPPVRQYTPPVRQYTPPARPSMPPIRQSAPPERHYAPPVRQSTPPPMRQPAPQFRQPARPPAQPQGPRPGNRPSRKDRHQG